jgi:hypothetical protein
MRQWVKDAHRTIRQAVRLATLTSDPRLHMACVNSIEAMIADGFLMPSNLRIYARQTRAIYGSQLAQQSATVAPQIAE